jgi:hypothetical protein
MRELERDDFLKELNSRFPEVINDIRQDEAGMLHCEVAAFRRVTEAALDAGRLWNAERYFRFVEELLESAGPHLRNALEVSYLEDLALGDWSPARHRAIKERMPRNLREILISHCDRWR